MSLLRTFRLFSLGVLLLGLQFLSVASAADSEANEPNLEIPQDTTPVSERTPVRIWIEADLLRSMTPEQREDVQKIIAIAEERLFTWKNFGFPEMPESMFSPDEPAIVEIASLFMTPTSNEVPKLATGKGSLTPAQLNDIRSHGVFRVPSREFPGQFHVWKVNSWLQEGIEHIEVRFYKNRDTGLFEFGIAVPNRLFNVNKRWSFAYSLRGIYRGLEELAGLFVGLPTRAPLYGDLEVRKLIQTHFTDALKKAPADLLEHRFLNANLMGKAGPIVLAIESRLDHNATNAEFQDALKDSPELEALSPRLGEALANRVRTIELLEQAQRNYESRLESWVLEQYEQLKIKAPIRARDTEWAASKIQNFAFSSGSRMPSVYTAYLGVSDQLEEEGLNKEARFVSLSTALMAHAQALLHQWNREQQPARKFEFKIPTLLVRNWDVEKVGDRFYIRDFSTATVNTGGFMWRAKNLAFRSIARFKGALQFLIFRNVINGVFGLKSLFKKKPFAPHWEANQTTGEIEPSGERGTLRSRVAASREKRRELLKDHRNSQETGFMGKNFERVTLFFKADLGYGLAAPLMIWTLQPAATAANLVASSALSVAAIPGVALVGLAEHARNILISDHDVARERETRKSRFFPGPKAALATAGHATIGLGGATVGLGKNLAVGSWKLSGGLIGPMASKLRDQAFFPLVKKLGRVPSKSNALARRISGPGLASQHAYQIAPDLALVAMLAQMERADLQYFREGVEREIEEPARALERFTAVFKAVFGENNGGQILAGSTPAFLVRNSVSERKKDLEDLTLERDLMLEKMTRMPTSVYLAEADLNVLLAKAEQLATMFYQDAMDGSWSERAIADFWSRRNLEKGDWMGVAKYELTAVFGPQILTPLERVDQTFTIAVDSPTDVSNLVAGLYFGIHPVDGPQLPQPLPPTVATATTEGDLNEVPSRVRGNLLCREILMDPIARYEEATKSAQIQRIRHIIGKKE